MGGRSATDLTSDDQGPLSWLRAYCPVGTLGGSILVYRFTLPPDGAPGPTVPAGPCTGPASTRTGDGPVIGAADDGGVREAERHRPPGTPTPGPPNPAGTSTRGRPGRAAPGALSSVRSGSSATSWRSSRSSSPPSSSPSGDWAPTSDNAIITTRAWDVLGPDSPLVGQSSSASGTGHQIYDLGPLLYWFLTVPVHLDHGQGALWGAAALGAAAALVVVESAWSARGWVAASVATAGVLVLVTTQPVVAVDPVWNPDVGTMWCLATVACAWAVALGRFRWFPVLVLAGSFAAQAHLMFAAVALTAIVVAPVVGVVRRRGIGGRWWIPAGVAVGIACWAAPVVQQLTGSPGNLASVLDWQGGGGPLGYRFGLRAIGTTVGAHPIWLTRPSGNAFEVYGDILYHPVWPGVAGWSDWPPWWPWPPLPAASTWPPWPA